MQRKIWHVPRGFHVFLTVGGNQQMSHISGALPLLPIHQNAYHKGRVAIVNVETLMAHY